MTCDKAPSVWDVATGRSDARNVFRQRIRLGEVGPPFLPTLRVRALYNSPRLLYSFLGESATSSRCVGNEYGDGGSRQSSRSSRTFTTRPFSRVSTRAGLRLSSSTQWGRTAAALDQSGERRRDDVLCVPAPSGAVFSHRRAVFPRRKPDDVSKMFPPLNSRAALGLDRA